jgi:hypothetical protein
MTHCRDFCELALDLYNEDRRPCKISLLVLPLTGFVFWLANGEDGEKFKTASLSLSLSLSLSPLFKKTESHYFVVSDFCILLHDLDRNCNMVYYRQELINITWQTFYCFYSIKVSYFGLFDSLPSTCRTYLFGFYATHFVA